MTGKAMTTDEFEELLPDMIAAQLAWDREDAISDWMDEACRYDIIAILDEMESSKETRAAEAEKEIRDEFTSNR